MGKTMVQECFSKIGKRIDGIANKLKRYQVPYEAEIEYLTFTPTTIILPQAISISSPDKIVLNIRIPDAAYSNSNRIFFGNWRGSHLNSTQLFVWWKYRATLLDFNTSERNTNMDFSPNNVGTFCNFGKDGNSFFFGNDETTHIQTGTSPVSECDFCIGGCSFTNGTASMESKFSFDLASFYFKSSLVTRDCIPVRIGTIGYLYDKVSNQLFGNVGTGNFILGPDK